MKVYLVDRQLLVNVIKLDMFNKRLLLQKMLEDLVLGGEFIITDTELLEMQGSLVPANLIINHDPLTDPAFIRAEDCKIVYVQPKP